MRTLLLSLLLVVVVGCSSFSSPPLPVEVTKAMITLTPKYDFIDRHQMGMATWYERDGVRYCNIILREYPAFLGHEVAHCFSGQWHGEESNGEDF